MEPTRQPSMCSCHRGARLIRKRWTATLVSTTCRFLSMKGGLTMGQPELNQAKVEEFGGRALDILNKAAVAVMMSVGHRTGLFETLASLPPSTTRHIADAAGLQERYVREWL